MLVDGPRRGRPRRLRGPDHRRRPGACSVAAAVRVAGPPDGPRAARRRRRRRTRSGRSPRTCRRAGRCCAPAPRSTRRAAVRLTVHCGGDAGDLDVEGRVVRCDRTADGDQRPWRVAITFVDMDPADDGPPGALRLRAPARAARTRQRASPDGEGEGADGREGRGDGGEPDGALGRAAPARVGALVGFAIAVLRLPRPGLPARRRRPPRPRRARSACRSSPGGRPCSCSRR